jgi:general stress protein CsbA
MKRRYLKKWVEVVLCAILLISLMVLGGESETYFITSKLISLPIFLISGYILLKYTKIED